ncbi:hypothetical protein H6P81_001244 [Aristolochia fimbriata]|uniref:Uncharacterized protein n=1 Tax=Aristolochia fimbriata TaxID=158543 RepID=A0AAV7FA75_ARIFI|nr:hypothetical protein H6P81_001244 [Aristolochia fimbriata]
MDSDESSDAPEEFTSEQGIRQDSEIKKIQWQNKTRVAREAKERRRKSALRKTKVEEKTAANAISEPEQPQEENEEQEGLHGMLPKHIVDVLAAREKQTFHSDSEDEATRQKQTPKKRKTRKTGSDPVILKDIPPAQCLQNSMEFLKKRKMNVSRSHAVLKSSNQALRLLSTTGLLR